MAKKGHIKLHRKILDWEWFKHPNTVVVWLAVLMLAEWRKTADLKQGQLVTTQGELAEITGLSRQQIRTALAHLTSTKELTIQPTMVSTKPASLITVENWRFYQMNPKDTNQGCNQGSNQGFNQSTLYKKNKEVKEEGNGNGEFDPVPMPDELKAKMASMFSMRKDN